ncbi:MAG: DUF3857 domain-containing protein [Nonlabens sp.]
MKLSLIAVIAVAFLTTTILYGQDKEEIESEFWAASAQEILDKSYPEEWSDESLIILTDDRYQQYINSGKNVYITSRKHQIMKIQDQSSLEDFSEISLDKDSKVSYLWSTYSKNETIIGIRLIKPDGTIKVIDVEKEEVIEDEKRKIAIPGLEIGDIIDLYIFTRNKEKEFDGMELYNPIETTIKDYYPIVDYRIAVEVENDFFLNMNTYNGAPEVKEEPTDRRATKRYVVEAKNLEKIETNRWYYPLVEEPAIKIQVAFARSYSNEKYTNAFTGEDGERKAEVTKEDILDYYKRKYSKVKKSRAKDIAKHLKNKGISDTREMFREALEYIRFYDNTFYFEGSLAHEAGIIGDYPSPSCYDFYFGRFESLIPVMYDLRSLCMILDVSYDELLVQPRYDGPMKDMLIKNNARRGIRINLDPPLYLLEYSENMTFDQIPANLEGAEVYIGKVEKDRKVVDLLLEKLPVSSAQDNFYKEKIKLSLTDDVKNVIVNRSYDITGHFKNAYRYDFTSWIEFLEEDYEVFDTANHFYDCGSKKAKKSSSEKFASLKAERQTQSEEFLIKQVEREWDAKIDNYTDQPINTGRYGINRAFEFENNFTIMDKFVKKAGPNVIFEIGKFIGGQIEIEKEDRKRESNIYLDYAKTYSYDIDLKIPEGYTVKGVDKLNVSVENETGGFTATAAVKDGVLKITTTKTYKKHYLDASQWDLMLPWLDAASDYSKLKVLLKKV